MTESKNDIVRVSKFHALLVQTTVRRPHRDKKSAKLSLRLLALFELPLKIQASSMLRSLLASVPGGGGVRLWPKEVGEACARLQKAYAHPGVPLENFEDVLTGRLLPEGSGNSQCNRDLLHTIGTMLLPVAAAMGAYFSTI